MASRDRTSSDGLKRYRSKRDFTVTSEPKAVRGVPARGKGLAFVIQKHAARRLHYDLRLEWDGVLLSWAVPKGPSFDPTQKRMAVHVEDHPVSYGGFEGTIPPKQYGAGTVIVWDRGTWEPVGDPGKGMVEGKLEFRLRGQKLAGLWKLIRIRKPVDKQDPWLLVKKADAWARPASQYDVVAALPDSVVAQPLRPLEERADAPAKRLEQPPLAEPARIAPDALSGAVKATLPATLAPQLATLAKTVPTRGDWLYEIKFDGYRLLARVENGRATLFTRGGHDWTSKLEPVARAVEGLGVRSGWLDGEIVVLDEHDAPTFHGLQSAIDSIRVDEIQYFVFDVPYLDGYDLRRVPLRERRAVLKQRCEKGSDDRVRFSADFPGDGQDVLRGASALHLEGIVAKRADAPYVSARTRTWLKLKCAAQQDFVIGGYTDRAGSSVELGSLLVGVHDDQGKLVFAGAVGTGWSVDTGRALRARLAKLGVKKSPFRGNGPGPKIRWSKRAIGTEHWVKPALMAQVSFSNWTPEGRIRHSSFQGLRVGEPVERITREKAMGTESPSTDRGSATTSVGPPKVTNADRIIDASTGTTKLDLLRYYESVGDRLLPHLAGRPVTLVRGPSGVAGELFFQKHANKLHIPGIQELDARLFPGHASLLGISTRAGLLGAAQMNTIEFHTWNSKVRNIDAPDRMVFDLDPGDRVAWVRLQEAALLVRSFLSDLGLESWLKTSGGKGLHVVVPIAPRLGYEAVKAFSQAVVNHLAKTVPSRFVAKSGPRNRIGKIFVDYIRNGHGATTVTAFSVRARPGLGVSMPVSWEELSSLESGAHFTIATARDHLSFEREDPWGTYWTRKQSLTRPMKRLGFVFPPPRAA